nr:MAG TPA: hypothetical protein [Bacteriophage sp.]DAZ33098.1 MAG TPA: hypothetical protein [Caudoviricetes sp.]
MTSECLFPNFSATCKLSHTACSFLRYTKSSITTLLSALQLFSELYKPMLQVFSSSISEITVLLWGYI